MLQLLHLCQTYKPTVGCSGNLAGVQDTSRIDFDDFMKVMDHMQKSNIPQTRKQAGFTDDEVTAAEQQYMIWMQACHPRYARMLMLGTSTQGYRGAGRAFPYAYRPRFSSKLLQSMTWMAMES